jgi:uncharacterized membrane protein
MNPHLSEWLNLLTRWFHVVVGVAWIGQTYLFSRLDRSMRPTIEADQARGVNGRLWMVHSGGFYQVDKQALTPESVPPALVWFRWEAALTWLSGFLLLWLVYYSGGVLVPMDASLSHAAGIGIGLAVLVVGWFLYDLLWMTSIGEKSGIALCFLALCAIAYGLTQLFTGRAAFIHVGALFGTIMAANVWVRILPGQRRLIAAVEAGEPADPTLAHRAAQRSKHNTFMSVPLIFLMISNHFPSATYGHRYNWLLLIGLVLLGWGARKVMMLLD